MTTFVMFWAALLAIIFFLLCFVFRALSAALSAILTAVSLILALAGIIIAVLFALFTLYAIVEMAVESGFDGVVTIVAIIALDVVMFGVVIWLLYYLGGGCLTYLVIGLVTYIIAVIMGLIDGAADSCEEMYVKMMKSYINRIPKS